MVIKGKSYREAIEKLGMSQAKASEFFGFSSRQSRRIAAGTATLGPAETKLLAVMLNFALKPAMVDELTTEPKRPRRAKKAADADAPAIAK